MNTDENPDLRPVNQPWLKNQLDFDPWSQSTISVPQRGSARPVSRESCGTPRGYSCWMPRQRVTTTHFQLVQQDRESTWQLLGCGAPKLSAAHSLDVYHKGNHDASWLSWRTSQHRVIFQAMDLSESPAESLGSVRVLCFQEISPKIGLVNKDRANHLQFNQLYALIRYSSEKFQLVLKGKLEMRLRCFVAYLICTRKKNNQGEEQLLA